MALIFGSPEANRIAQADRQRQRQIEAGYRPSWRSAEGWQLVDIFLAGDDSPAHRWPNEGRGNDKQ
jgi:hypothetical protein